MTDTRAYQSGPWLVITPAAAVDTAGETWVASSTPVEVRQ